MASVASVYIGEWAAGVKQGYGIMDDIMTGINNIIRNKKEMISVIIKLNPYKHRYWFTKQYIILGEKYLGSWSNGMKHGCGLIVTLNGIYYEGVFMQDVLTVNNYKFC